MDELNSYLKKNTALELIETEGFTNDFPDSVRSRFINKDFLLDSAQSDTLRNIYGKPW